MGSVSDSGGIYADLLPWEMAAEKAVLGSMMLSKDAIAEIADILHEDNFREPRHKLVYRAALSLFGSDERVDPVQVAAALDDAGRLDECGGAPYLISLVEAVPVGAAPTALARAVADASLRARLLDTGHKITQIAASDKLTDVRAAVDLAQAAIHELTERESDDPFAYPELLQPLLDHIERPANLEPATRGHMPTGFDDLDRLTGGLWPGTLNVIGGRPSVGKTTLALSIARHVAARLNRTTVYFTRETSKIEIARRIAAAEARVPLQVLRSGQLSDDDWTKLARSLSGTSETPLYIDDKVRTVGEIRAKSRRMHARLGLELIIVDYLQLFANGYHDRYRELSDITRDLKDLARELDIPVLAISQLNRGPEQRTDHRPQLADLRDSGTVEDDADLVIFVYREDHYDRESPRAGEADLIVAKHRHGPTDTVTVAAQLHLSRFVDMAFPPA